LVVKSWKKFFQHVKSGVSEVGNNNIQEQGCPPAPRAGGGGHPDKVLAGLYGAKDPCCAGIRIEEKNMADNARTIQSTAWTMAPCCHTPNWYNQIPGPSSIHSVPSECPPNHFTVFARYALRRNSHTSPRRSPHHLTNWRDPIPHRCGLR